MTRCRPGIGMELESGVKWIKRVAVQGPASLSDAAAAAASMEHYDGSRVFSWLAELSGLPIDQVRDAAGRRGDEASRARPGRRQRVGRAGRAGGVWGRVVSTCPASALFATAAATSLRMCTL